MSIKLVRDRLGKELEVRGGLRRERLMVSNEKVKK